MLKKLPIHFFCIFAPDLTIKLKQIKIKTMKKTVLFILLATIIGSGAFALTNPFTPGSGGLPNDTVGISYNFVIHFTVPDSITVNPHDFNALLPAGAYAAPLDTVMFAITGLHAGLMATFSPSGSLPSGTYLHGQTGTVTISGTSTGNASMDSVKITSLSSGSFNAPAPIGHVVFPGTVTFPIIGAQNVPRAPKALDGGPYAMRTAGPSGIQELNVYSFNAIQNVPNPFTWSTTVKFNTPTGGNIDFKVYNMLGKLVYAEKLNATPGANQKEFNAGDLSAGTYFYTLSNNTQTITKKMVISSK